MTNPVLETIAARRSVRAYTDESLTGEQIDALTMAALASPSGMNKQPWQFILVQNLEMLHEMENDIVEYFVKAGDTEAVQRLQSRKNQVFYDAPLVIFVAVKGDPGVLVDAGIAVQNISLAAASMGLGSVILGYPSYMFAGEHRADWEKRLGFPDGYQFGISIAVGHAADSGAQHPHDQSKITVL